LVKGYGYKSILVLSIIAIIVIFLSGCDTSETQKAETEIGNYAGGGLIAGKDNLVFFINPADYNKIYSYDEQSGKYLRISNDSVSSIFIDDDWIYHQNLFNKQLSRIRIDGTNFELLNIAPTSYTRFFSYFIADGWIYYKWWDWDFGGKGGIYRLSADGGTLEPILEDGVRVKDFFVAGDWIYYTSLDDEGYHDGFINIIGIDGGDPVMIGDYAANEIIVYEGYLYFKNNEFKLYRVSIDGGEAIKLSENEIIFYNIFDNWIYYTNRDDNFRLYKMRTDGSESQKISDDKSSMIHIINGWIYYSNINDGGRMYRIKIDGSQKQDLFAAVRPEEAFDASKPLVVSGYYLNFDTDWLVDGKRLNLGMHENDILHLMGAPETATDKDCSDDDYSPVCTYHFEYPGVLLSLVHRNDKPENARLITLETDSPLVAGPRAISVGDTFAQVLEKLPDNGNPVEEASEYQKDMYEYYQLLYGSYSVSGPICEIYYDENKSPIKMSFRDGIGDTSYSLYSSGFTLHFKDGLVSSMIMGHSCWCRLN